MLGIRIPRLRLGVPHLHLRWMWMLPVRLVWTWPRRGVLRLLLVVWRWVCAQGRLLRSSPLAFYRAMGRRRDVLVARIEYAHAESAKWRSMWACVRSPYSLLRACGFSPQMAAGLLFAGSAVGGGVVVNETIFAEKDRKSVV